MTKKQKKAQNNANRVFIYMNTGTHTHTKQRKTTIEKKIKKFVEKP